MEDEEEGSERRRRRRETMKEQERERRRIRDRQRRQSMSLDEREKHLARRRRNYQLRRLRAQTSLFHHHLTAATNVECNNNNNYVTAVECHSNVTVGLEIPAHKLATLPTRLRLNHLKHLARSLDDNQTAAADFIITANEIQNANADSTCVTPQSGLRLNRVKHLARSINSDLEKSTPENGVEHKNQLNGLQLCSLSQAFDQPYLVRCATANE
ncbi:uncharacterized protein LOC126665181 isoform X1 [Mercurialis annua]|uniref:uncharacterized protein LOC126665181 isoform X1 n=2 Tax=Mercurialis annua TaxID=3986 RepID=UPI00215F6F53|nr:uncharacterized protein LOC126665181 isoform X1 [Mercurialis annua]